MSLYGHATRTFPSLLVRRQHWQEVIAFFWNRNADVVQMLKQNIRPPLVMALESQNMEWLKLILSSPDTRLDHVEDDSCTPGSTQ